MPDSDRSGKLPGVTLTLAGAVLEPCPVRTSGLSGSYAASVLSGCILGCLVNLNKVIDSLVHSGLSGTNEDGVSELELSWWWLMVGK